MIDKTDLEINPTCSPSESRELEQNLTLIKRIEIYSYHGKEPFNKWFESLRDKVAQTKIMIKIERLSQGNYGNHRHLGAGLFELKIDYGPGYRVYCGNKDNVVVIVLCGGSKSRQNNDIAQAKEYWNEFLTRRKSNE